MTYVLYLHYCTDFSQIWYHWKVIFEENPAPYFTKDEDYSLWKTSAITEIAPLGSFWRYLEYVKSGFFLSGRSPLLPRTFSFSLAPIWVRFGLFWGRNMTFTSRIPSVWVLFIVEWACRVEFSSESGC